MNDVKEQLKLPVIKSENLSIKVFGSRKTNSENLDLIQKKKYNHVQVVISKKLKQLSCQPFVLHYQDSLLN